MDNSLTCTNTYVFLKKYSLESDERTTSDQDVFKPVRPLTFSNHVKHIEINFSVNENTDGNCCENLLVFSDESFENVSSSKVIDCGKNENVIWYRSKDFFSGFKDCYVNKISASELW